VKIRVSLPRLGDEDESLSTEVIAFLRDAFRRPLAADAEFVAVTIPVPSEAAEKFLRLVPREMGFLWRSPGSQQLAGGGAAATIRVSGVSRFQDLERATPLLFAKIESRAFSGSPPPAIVVGGAAFAHGVPPIEPWEEFTEDAFVLPRWGYRRQGTKAELTVTITRDELADTVTVDRTIEEVRTLVRALDYESATSIIERFDIPRSAVHHLGEADWKSYIDAIHAAIGSGRFQKIVAARRCVVDLRRPVEDTGFVARLSAAYPDCTHFAIRRENSTFLGVTPETLFRKRGTQLVTHALAGTLRIADDPYLDSSKDVARLQASEKDQGEHAVVVQKICEDLWPLSKKITYAPKPEGRQVRHLVHLQTPINVELRETTTVFELLATLHPTPAVGGFPARDAAEWIRHNEPLERGWYTGVVGWLDASGDGEFAVAIRCGVLERRRATIYAGAGVMAASTAVSEYAETGAKMVPVLRALGVAT
jgi:menaquinone-specific isochorismate synthase